MTLRLRPLPPSVLAALACAVLAACGSRPTGHTANAPACGAGQLLCGGACVDPATDGANCGACRAACGGADVCVGGTCGPGVRVTIGLPASSGVVPAVPFAQAVQVDAALAVSTVTGVLTNAAPGGGAVQLTFAASGASSGGTTTWTATSPTIDPSNGLTGTLTVTVRDAAWRAGAPDAALHEGVQAADVRRECGPAEAWCAGSCVDPATDRANCGACGNGCHPDEACLVGVCQPCPVAMCGNACVDPATDAQHCGACGVACGGTDVCVGGTCGPGVRVTIGLPASSGLVPAAPFAQAVQVDAALAVSTVTGVLTNAAPGGATAAFAFALTAGANAGGSTTWTGTSPTIDPSNGLTGVLTVTVRDAAWRAGAPDAALHEGVGAATVRRECPPGQTVCGSACVDLQTDRASCGACGVPCLGNEACLSGACQPCPVAMCGNACVDTAIDRQHCGACGVACGGTDACLAAVCGPPVRVAILAPADAGIIPRAPFPQQVRVDAVLAVSTVAGQLTNAAPALGTVQFPFTLASGPDAGGTSTWVATAPPIDETNGPTGTLTVAAFDVAWQSGAPDAALHTAAAAVDVERDPLVAALPFATPGCFPTGSAMGGTVPITFSRLGVAENTVAGAPVSCPNQQARVGDDGLILEPTRVQYVTNPLAPAAETRSLPGGISFFARLEGTGSLDLAPDLSTTPAVATGLPCTVTAAAPCAFSVTAAGNVTFTPAGAISFAQVESGGFPTSRIHPSTRMNDAASIANPLPPADWCAGMTVTPTAGRAWNTVAQQGLFSAGAPGAADTWAAYVLGGSLVFDTFDASALNRRITVKLLHGADPGTTHRVLVCSTYGELSMWLDTSRVGMDDYTGTGTGVVSSQPPTLLVGSRGAGNEVSAAIRDVKLYRGGYSPAVRKLEPPYDNRSILCLGDSITYGLGRVATPYPETLWANLLGLPWYATNAGVSGNTTSQMFERWILTYRDAGYASVVVLGGVNDILQAPSCTPGPCPPTVQTIQTNLGQIYDEAIARGMHVVAVTILPFGGGNTPWSPEREAWRQEVNAWILGRCAADPAHLRCVDAATDFLDPGTITTAAAMKKVYDHGDNLHLNQVGTDRLAADVWTAFP